ncbi:aldehyde dehydrogenase family protein [Ochrobactrum daejeonense]|nr:aldehyde dehydrogenase family protein [Brucella daejeonensis]
MDEAAAPQGRLENVACPRRNPLCSAGCGGVIAPWNYPVNLALAPLVAAIAAGNHVFLKPSEHTPRTAEFLRSLLADVFPDDRVAVALGDASLSAQFASLPFDHLFSPAPPPSDAGSWQRQRTT